MLTMRFSGIARLQIMGILNDKAKGKMLDPEFQKALKLYEKIYIPDEYQESELSVKDKDGKPTQQLDMMKLKNMPALEVELDHNELTKLEDKLKEFEFSPVQLIAWVNDVMAQIEEAKKPTIQSEETRDRNLTEFRAQNQPKKAGRAG